VKEFEIECFQFFDGQLCIGSEEEGSEEHNDKRAKSQDKTKIRLLKTGWCLDALTSKQSVTNDWKLPLFLQSFQQVQLQGAYD
jgi:hypothetical protein